MQILGGGDKRDSTNRRVRGGIMMKVSVDPRAESSCILKHWSYRILNRVLPGSLRPCACGAGNYPNKAV